MAQPGLLIFQNSDELSAHAADFVVRVTQDAIAARGRAMLALAGGTTPQATYRLLSRSSGRDHFDWERTLLFFTDERFVPPNDPASNFGMVQRALLDSVDNAHVFPVPTQLPTATAAAAAYEATLANVFDLDDRRDQSPRFDLILLGVGEDGHVAALFSGAASLTITERWVVASPPGSLPPHVERLTMTLPVLNAAREILFLVSGSRKAEVLRDVLEARQPLPAARVHPVDGTLTWFVDEDAANLLKR